MTQTLRNLIAKTFAQVVKLMIRSLNALTQVFPNFKTAIAIAEVLERFQRISQQAFDLFEDPEESRRWLTTPKSVLGGKTPIECLETEAGARKVEALLYRAEYGIWG